MTAYHFTDKFNPLKTFFFKFSLRIIEKLMKMKVFYVVFALYFPLISSLDNCFEPYCSCDIDEKILNCLNFTTFTQLDFKTNKIAWKEVHFSPLNALKLSSNLDLDGMKLDTSLIPKIKLSNINAFDIDYNPFKKVEFIGNSNKFDLTFLNTKWIFESAFQDLCLLSDNREFIFSSLNLNSFNMYFGDFISSARFCPLMFYNSTIYSMEFLRPSGNLNFVQVSPPDYKALNINIYELKITGGDNAFPKVLTQTSILNRDLFSSIKSLVLRNTDILFIDENLLEKFENLKSLQLLNIKLENLLKNGSNWLANLNSKVNFNLENDSLSEEIVKNNAFKLVLGDEDTLRFEDSDLCLFESFPHNSLVFVFIETSKDLACSCSIYWLYKNYQKYKTFLTADETAMVPTYCLNINSVLLNEQIDYCNIDQSLKKCKESDKDTTKMDTTITTTKRTKSCLNQKYKCECNFEVFNYLKCSDSGILEVPEDFSTEDEVKWNYVTFVGSSISTISDFNSLELDKNAVIVVKNITNFGSRIFSKVLTDSNYQFIVEDSNMASLGRNLVFLSANLSLLELTDCSFTSTVLVNAFEGAQIDSLLIKTPRNVNIPFEFKKQPLFRDPKIRKFKIDKAYDSFTNFFNLDSFVLPQVLFNALEELEISSTQLASIDSYAIGELINLKVVKLSNVSLVRVIENSIDEKNWLSSIQIRKLFIGREYQAGFTFQDDYFCYFTDMHDDMNVYIYDSIDFPKGPKCTCTIFWFYRNLDFEALKNDEFENYVPKCIKELESTEKIKENLEKCLNNVDVETFCKTSSTTKLSITSEVTFDQTITTTYTTEKITTENDKTNLNTLEAKISFYGFIAVATLLIIVLIALIVLCCKFYKIKKLFKDLAYNQYKNKQKSSKYEINMGSYEF